MEKGEKKQGRRAYTQEFKLEAAELFRLKRELMKVTAERDTLKKAFAKELQ